MLARLPKVELGHSDGVPRRRFLNWFPLGLTYAFLYMGRYNLNEARTRSASCIDQGGLRDHLRWGTLIYGFSFLINGPLTDRLGGRDDDPDLRGRLGGRERADGRRSSGRCCAGLDAARRPGARGSRVLYAREHVLPELRRGLDRQGQRAPGSTCASAAFGGIFGILISLGLYFALRLEPR